MAPLNIKSNMQQKIAQFLLSSLTKSTSQKKKKKSQGKRHIQIDK